MKTRAVLALGSIALLSLNTVLAQEIFRDQMTSGAGWAVNANSADYSATFGYNYSADGIPEAPNSRGGDSATSGVKLEANLVNGAASVFTLYPIGQSFTGDYQLRFDAWMNYDADERINGGSAGTTEFIGGGLGYDNTLADIGIGAQVMATGDGGSGSDWRIFADGAFLDPSEMTGQSRNGFEPYYSDFLPGIAPPGAQAQTAFPAGTAGSPGFQWITFEITSIGGVATMWIEKPSTDRLLLAIYNDLGERPYTSDGNIGLTYADWFTSVTSRPDLTFGVIDNVEVIVVPEPTTAALALLGGVGLLMALRRRR